jgi:hypothetical protein
MSGLFGDVDSDEDSITTASTVESDQEEDASFPVADILADKYDPERGSQVYLILWEGYPLHRASWEPPGNFNAKVLIEEYVQRCAEGKVDKALNLERYHEAVEEAQSRKNERTRRRERKRALRAQKARQQQASTQPNRKKAKRTSEKLIRDAPNRRSEERLEGFIVGDDEGLEEEADSFPSSWDEDDSDAAPTRRRRTLRKKKPRKAPPVPISSEEESDSDSDADSLMDAIASEAKKKKGIAKATRKEGAIDTKRTGRKLEKTVSKKRPLRKSPSPVHRKRQSVAEKKNGAAIGTATKTGTAAKTATRTAVKTPTKTVTAKKGIAATQRPTQTGIQNDPTKVRTYDKLSIRNKVAKRGRQDRAPAAEELNLINLGGSSRAADGLIPGLNDLVTARRESLAKRKRSQSAEPAGRGKPATERTGGPRAPVAQAKPAPAPTKQTQAPAKAPAKAPEKAPAKAPEKAAAKAPAKAQENAPAKQTQAQARTEQPSEKTGPRPGPEPRKPSQAMPEPPLQSPTDDHPMDIDMHDAITPEESVPAPIVQPNAAPPPRPCPEPHFLPIWYTQAPPQAQLQPQQIIPIQSVPETLENQLEAMEIDRPDPTEFSCEVFYGTSMAPSNSLGVIKFDFGVEFLAMLRDVGLDKIWISKSLENRYIREKFVPVSKCCRSKISLCLAPCRSS